MKRVMLAAGWLARGFLIFCVRAYQVVISPHLGHCCRFEPSCSAYCIEAIQKHGAIRGGWLAARRVLRCRPFGPSGFDPVPPARGGTVNDRRNNGQRSSYG